MRRETRRPPPAAPPGEGRGGTGAVMKWATLGRGRFYFVVFVLPAVLYVIAWRISPALYTLWLGLTQYNIVYDAAPQWNHLENYQRLSGDRTLFDALKLSGVFGIAATAVELVVG